MVELNILNVESQKQNMHVNKLKGLMEQGNPSGRTLLKQSVSTGNGNDGVREIHKNRPCSRSKGRGLFTSNNLGKSSSKVLLKRVKSS